MKIEPKLQLRTYDLDSICTILDILFYHAKIYIYISTTSTPLSIHMFTTNYTPVSATYSFTSTGEVIAVDLGTAVRDAVIIRNLTANTLMYVSSTASGAIELNSIFEPVLGGEEKTYPNRTGIVYIKPYAYIGESIAVASGLISAVRESSAELRGILNTISALNSCDDTCESYDAEISLVRNSDYTYLDTPALSLNIGSYDVEGYSSVIFTNSANVEFTWISGVILNAGAAGQQSLGMSIEELPAGNYTVYPYAVIDGSQVSLGKIKVVGK